MTKKYGYDIEDWENAKEEMRQILIGRAKQRQTIPYSDLVAKVKAIDLPRNSPAFWDMLGEISTEEDTAGRGLLTVIVIHGKGDTLPGAGFFQLAKRLERDTSDKKAFWTEELRRVYGSWSTAGERAEPDRITRPARDEIDVSHDASSRHKDSTKFKYPTQSEFIGALRAGVKAGKPRLEKGHPIEIALKLGGYRGKWTVIISPDDPDEFEVEKPIRESDRFSRRIRVAAWALFQEGVFGGFIIEYDRQSGIMTIQRAEP